MKRKPTAVEYEQVKTTVEQWENVAAFLRRTAQQVAVVPNLSSEIVRSSLVVAGFLEDRAATARREVPKAFEEKTETPEKEPKKDVRVAARRRT